MDHGNGGRWEKALTEMTNTPQTDQAMETAHLKQEIKKYQESRLRLARLLLKIMEAGPYDFGHCAHCGADYGENHEYTWGSTPPVEHKREDCPWVKAEKELNEMGFQVWYRDSMSNERRSPTLRRDREPGIET